MNKSAAKKLPQYCDYLCEFASFTDTALSGACRRENAVYCSIWKKYNNKNAKCLVGKKEKRKK
jgi:hypothetical protein